MKRIFISGLSILLTLTIAGCAKVTTKDGGKEKTEKTKIVIADAKTTHHLNLYVAKELGYFDDLNLDVEIKSVDDNAASRDLVVSGGADVFWSCPTIAIAAVANGAPIKAIAQVKAPCTSVLVVKEDSPIKNLSDLQDKKVAGISATCEAVISITAAAKVENTKFNLEKLAGGPAIQALTSGAVDAAILEEPHVSIAQLQGYRVVSPDISANIPCRTINATDTFIDSNPEALKLFVEAVDKANKKIVADPTADDIVDIAVKYTGAPKEAVKHGNERLKFDVKLKTDGLKALGEALKESGNIKENPGDKIFSEKFKGVTW